MFNFESANPDRFRQIETSALIIGAGAAGLRTAIELTSNQIPCLVAGKRKHGDAHTRMAAGGINACFGNLDPEDRWQIHAADTLREGHFICQPRSVELLALKAPERVLELSEWGCHFDRTPAGKINQRFFGAQSFRRTCFVGDITGEAVLETLLKKAEALEIPILPDIFISKLIQKEKRMAGAFGFNLESGERLFFKAPVVVLAAGGCTSLYKRSSSREDENTGDAMGLAYEAGALLRDMEFVQFHPTGMIKPPQMKGRLVTEAMRGEGARLFNKSGERFMERYSPQSMELDARDVVARANYQEIQNGRGTPDGGVLLDISHQPAELIQKRLPRMYHQFLEQGTDITREPVEVAPTAHYPMGGIRMNPETGETDVGNLFAVGECASGLHGANRLGGNSLAETVVFGQLTGAFIAQRLHENPQIPPLVESREIERYFFALRSSPSGGKTEDSAQIASELRHLMWEHAGIVRAGNGLEEGVEKLRQLEERVSVAQFDTGSFQQLGWAILLPFMLITAKSILLPALMRTESRGAHYRTDFPEATKEWEKNIVCAKDETGEMRLWTEPVPPIPTEIRETLAEHHALDYHQLE